MKKKLLTAIILFIFSIQINVNATCNHQWENWWVDYDCDCFSNGLKRRQCELCYDEETKIIPAYGSHDWSEWEIVDHPTCVDNGSAYRNCKRCYQEETKKLPAIPEKHNWSKWSVYDEPDCLNDGEERRYCTYCELYESKILKKNQIDIIFRIGMQ